MQRNGVTEQIQCSSPNMQGCNRLAQCSAIEHTQFAAAILQSVAQSEMYTKQMSHTTQPNSKLEVVNAVTS